MSSQNTYPLGTVDVPVALGHLLHRMRRFPEALRRYRDSLDLHGDAAVTQHDMGLCLYRMGQHAHAAAAFRRALALGPTVDASRNWLVCSDA